MHPNYTSRPGRIFPLLQEKYLEIFRKMMLPARLIIKTRYGVYSFLNRSA